MVIAKRAALGAALVSFSANLNRDVLTPRDTHSTATALRDIMHFCDAQGIAFDDCLKTGAERYNEDQDVEKVDPRPLLNFEVHTCTADAVDFQDQGVSNVLTIGAPDALSAAITGRTESARDWDCDESEVIVTEVKRAH